MNYASIRKKTKINRIIKIKYYVLKTSIIEDVNELEARKAEEVDKHYIAS